MAPLLGRRRSAERDRVGLERVAWWWFGREERSLRWEFPRDVPRGTLVGADRFFGAPRRAAQGVVRSDSARGPNCPRQVPGVIPVDVVAPMPAGSDGSSRRGGDQRPVNRGWREDSEMTCWMAPLRRGRSGYG